MARPGARHRWLFSIVNYTESEYTRLQVRIETVHPRFAVLGKNHNDTGMPVLNGYIHLKTRMRLNQLRQIIGIRAQIDDRARTTDIENESYVCREDSSPWILGVPYMARRPKKMMGCRLDGEAINLLIDL